LAAARSWWPYVTAALAVVLAVVLAVWGWRSWQAASCWCDGGAPPDVAPSLFPGARGPIGRTHRGSPRF
ncbi:MAG: hypothetical protein DI577_04755, partial [Microbacterium sp.]